MGSRTRRGTTAEARGSDSGRFALDRAGLLTLLEHLDEGVVGLRFDGTITFASAAIRNLLGWDPASMVGSSMFDFVRREDVDRLLDSLARWQGRRGSVGGEVVQLRGSDGRWVEVSFQVTIDTRLGPVGDLAVTFRATDGWDAARLALVERALNEDRLVRLASTFVSHGPGRFQEGLDEAVAELAGLSFVTRVSIWRVVGDRLVRRATWSSAHDAPTADLPQRLPVALLPRLAELKEVSFNPERLPETAIGRTLVDSGVTSFLSVPMSVGGRLTGFIMIESTLPERSFDATHFATVRSASAVLAQAFERHDLEQELASRASVDRLTSLPNRWSFEEDLHGALTAIVEGRTRGVAVALMDLDRFKVVNDSLGHHVGDNLLVEVAHRLASTAKLHPRLGEPARLGGDEFIVLIDECRTASDAATAAEVLVEALGPPFDVEGHAVRLTASVGVAHTSSPSTDANELLRRSDLAMYRAKDQGGDRVALEDRAERARMTSRVRDEADLREAIDHHQLAVHYQGEWHLPTGTLIGAEALVRWDHPQRGLLTADQFIPLAEDAGLIVDLGRSVLTEACEAASGWIGRAGGPDLVLRVNVSARQLQDDSLVDEVSDALSVAGLAPERLCLEVTESTLLADPAGAAVALEKLRALGVGVAVDDFGTGFCSLLYLKQLPVSSLKIDKAFIDGVAEDPRDRAIVAAVTRLAKEIGITATAEGVESEVQRGALLELGCDRAQGFLLSRPEPLDDFERRLVESAPAARPE